MTSAVPALYEPLIARDLEAVPPAVRAFRETATPDELYLAVARFAVLAYAPSHHAKHAVLAALSALQVRDSLGERWDELLTEVAYYAAASRQPWSEPPIADPPLVDDATPAGPEELRAAILAGDRLRAEQWLARNLDEPSLERVLAGVAAEDLSDLGHNVIMTNAALKLVPILGEKGRYITLRMAVWEMTAQRAQGGSRYDEDLHRLIERCVAENGSLESAHGVFLFDAMLELRDPLTKSVTFDGPAPVYRLARDMGATLKAHAVAARLKVRFPAAPLDDFVAAVRRNLETAPSLEEWSFA